MRPHHAAFGPFAAFVGLVACSATPGLEPAPGLPTRAEGTLLLATLADGRVEVGGTLVGAPQTVDLDAPEDERFAFRYQVLGGGDVLYERSTGGPVLVDAFLGYWSGVSGVDILSAVPNLGRFPVLVPQLEGADEVQFQLRQADGSYADAGSWAITDPEPLDLGLADDILAGSETLWDSGPSENRLDLVIVADGYTEADQALFRQHARQLKEHLLDTEPFASLQDHINIHRVDTLSAQAGAAYDCADGACGPVDNALTSIFAIALVNLMTGSGYDSRAIFQADQWRVAQAVSVVPWDQVIVLVNSPTFGGMAVHYATATTGVVGWKETAVHELGHALGQLGDEYVYDDCIRSDALGLPPNVAASPDRLPWAHWVEAGTPLPTTGDEAQVGAWLGAFNCDDLYRPRSSCKMRDRGDFCEVCAEQLSRAVLRWSDPIDEVEQAGDEVIVHTIDPAASVAWSVGEDGGTVAPGEAFRPRLKGGDELVIEVAQDSDFVRVHEGELEETVRLVVPE